MRGFVEFVTFQILNIKSRNGINLEKIRVLDGI